MFDIQKLTKIRRAPIKNQPGYRAPHKPILLLSIIWMIHKRRVSENKFYLDENITEVFKKLWSIFVVNKSVHPKIFLPFYHLSKDKGIWNLHTVSSETLNLTASYSPKSLSSLMDSIDYAELNEDLYQDLKKDSNRHKIWEFIQVYFFPELQLFELDEININAKSYDFVDQDLIEVYSEPKEKYWKELELVSRNSYFKKRVPEIYDYTCAVTKLKLSRPYQRTLLDACHIEPWSKRYNDSIRNGICLTPTIHRAFDGLLFTISENYDILISPSVKHLTKSSLDFTALNGNKILLPTDKRLYPSQELLENHRKAFFDNRE